MGHDVEKLLADVLGAKELEPVVVSLPAARVVPRVVEMLKGAIERHPGGLPMHVRLSSGSRTTTLALPKTVSNSIRADLRAMFGPNACSE